MGHLLEIGPFKIPLNTVPVACAHEPKEFGSGTGHDNLVMEKLTYVWEAEMQYELTIKILINSPFGKERIARQMESLFEFGTISESVVDGLGLDETPRLSGVNVTPASSGLRH